jgi:hypothetical protein
VQLFANALTKLHVYINLALKEIIYVSTSLPGYVLRRLMFGISGHVYLIERIRVLSEHIMSAGACHLCY